MYVLLDFQKTCKKSLKQEDANRGRSAQVATIYRDVDLGSTEMIHRDIPVVWEQGMYCGMSAYGKLDEDTAHWKIQWQRQRCFVRTMQERPMLGQLVRAIRWTIFQDIEEDAEFDGGNPVYEARFNEGTSTALVLLLQQPISLSSDQLWAAFQTLENVLSVDLAFPR